jgi:MFS family permease
MTLSKKDDPARRWRSFKRHAFLLLQPLGIAAFAVSLWHRLRRMGIHFATSDEAILTGAIIATLGIAFSIIAAVVFTKILDKYSIVVRSVLRRDKNTFLLYRDERLPIIIHLVLASLSLSLISMVILIDYHNVYTGVCSVFAVTFSISLYFIVATELQNPAKSAWFAERIPHEWLEVDIDKHFKLIEQNGKEKKIL